MLLLDVHRTFRKTGKKMKVKVAQSCLTLCNTMDCSTLVSSVHRILQTRILEWVAMPFSRDLPDLGLEPRSPTLQADSLLFELFGNPLDVHRTFRKASKKINITKFLLNASFGDIDFYFLLTNHDTMVLSE